MKSEQAWERLKERLREETPHPRWNQWAKSHPSRSSLFSAKGDAKNPEEIIGLPHSPAAALQESVNHEAESLVQKKWAPSDLSRFGIWVRQKKKRLAATAAAFLTAAVLISPAGNDVLAALLKQFRMEQITVVQEDDLQRLFNQVFESGAVETSVNRYGEFTLKTGDIQGPMSLDKIKEQLEWEPAVLPGFDGEIYVFPSQQIDFKINVEEVNATMKRLGAQTPLPEEVDGKTITLKIGEAVEMYAHDSDQREYRNLIQMKVPVVNVSDDIPVEKALEAVIQFPLLPETLKESLSQASVLERGSVPLPLVVNDKTEKISFKGTDVLVSAENMDSGTTIQETMYKAVWIKDGILYQLSGTGFDGKDSLLNTIDELMSS